MSENKIVFDAKTFGEQMLHELETGERYLNFFSGYQPHTVESFKKDFVRKKTRWFERGDINMRNAESSKLRWLDKAWDQFDLLQQKKLFDKQCLWRAEKITIEEIKIGYDFRFWEEDVLNCPFVEPITRSEIDLYIQYLQSENVQLEKDWFLDNWQDYDEIKKAYETENANRNFPEWYDFHSGRTGTGVYLTLPDIRGEKEKRYYDLSYDEAREQNREANEKWERERDTRPMLQYYKDNFYDWFVSTYENKQTQKYYQAWKETCLDKNPYDAQAQQALWDLQESPGQFPIEGHYDWRQGLIRAAEKFNCHKIAEAMSEAFEEYKMRIDSGFPFERNEESVKQYEHIGNQMRERILRGRELSGEPRDFNF